MEDIAGSTNRLLLRRISAFLALILFLNMLDRVNVSFASFGMSQEIGLDPRAYGFGIGLFFVTYMLFMLPAMAAAERFGLAHTIATMVVSCGCVSTAMCLIAGKPSFYALRLALGIAEAGLPSAIILYSSRWAPSALTARFLSWASLAFPASFVLGAPLSGWIMASLNGIAGVSGWRWMFGLEGAVSIIVGLTAFVWLHDSPATVPWLSASQRAWLSDVLARERRRPDGADRSAAPLSRRLALTARDPNVWALGAVMFSISMGFYGFLYWLPQVVKLLTPNSSTLRVMLISALPWIGAALGMVLIGRRSDRTGERHLHLAGASIVAALGLACAAASSNAVLSFAALIFAGVGVGGAQGIFFSLPIRALRGKAHVGIAVATINLLGNAAGLVGANAIGMLRYWTGSFSSSIFLLACTYVVGAIIAIIQRRWTAD